ncbi:Dhfs-fpgs c isoform 1 [Theobroma cacao]|uniref:Folylpolyglutamate synthase n=1 Tax=Theobroma cacao TaxID=3641 RepID=A0A061F3L1_THECC|nr:Dhfs-fpgs c isoform 1 [Theobroma cacao]
MIGHANTVLKCGIFGLSNFHEQEQFFFTPGQIFSCLAISLHNQGLTRDGRLQARTKSGSKLHQCSTLYGFRYSNMSSQVLENMGSNEVIRDYLEDVPLSFSYEPAMDALSSLITRQKRGERSNVMGKYGKLDRMLMYLKILGLEEQVAGLKIIHVAGTKGKGSTCTFCEAILRESGFRTGLFTSPHLIDVRERFRLDGLEISEEKFLQYFWNCWHILKENITDALPMPPLFQFLTVLAFKIFVCEQVDVAIIEVGLGGTRDSTNVIKQPVVCGITSLGMDHMETLGNTLGQIALHKAGIFKHQIPAFTVPQLSEAMEVLQERAHELMVPLNVAAPLDSKNLKGVKISLSGDHQLINAGLAVSLCKCWLQRTGNWEKILHNDSQETDIPEAFCRGLSTACLSGRAEIVYDKFSKYYNSSATDENSCGNLIFYLDGAHSPESMEACARWFSSVAKGNGKVSPLSLSALRNFGNGCARHIKDKVEESHVISKQILLFNCMEVRDPQVLLTHLVNACSSSGTHLSKALFVPNMSKYNKVTSGTSITASDSTSGDFSWQFSLQRIWEKVIHGPDPVLDRSTMMNRTVSLPSLEFLYEDAFHCSAADQHLACSAVMPSLPQTIKWLRDCVKEKPSVRVQVLVTGSLHLVGDVLKLLRR